MLVSAGILLAWGMEVYRALGKGVRAYFNTGVKTSDQQSSPPYVCYPALAVVVEAELGSLPYPPVPDHQEALLLALLSLEVEFVFNLLLRCLESQLHILQHVNPHGLLS